MKLFVTLNCCNFTPGMNCFSWHIIMNVYLFLYLLWVVYACTNICIILALQKYTAHKPFFITINAFYCIVAMLYWVTFNKKTLIKANIPPLHWYLNNIRLCWTLFLNRWPFIKQYIKSISCSWKHFWNVCAFDKYCMSFNSSVIRVSKHSESITTGSRKSPTSRLRFQFCPRLQAATLASSSVQNRTEQNGRVIWFAKRCVGGGL